MKHKCDGCRYKSEHQEMGFRPMGVCTKETDLVNATKNYDADVCPYEQTKPMNTEQIIKPCPFCGGKAKVSQCLSNHKKYRVTHTCVDRYPHIEFYHYYFDTPQEARDFWNKRADEQKIKELQTHIENLKKENKYLRDRLTEEAEIKEDMEGEI